MSTIATVWAYSQKLGNPTAKAVLAFLASHNFAGDQSTFKVSTICSATDFEERAVRKALLFLAERNLILKQARYGATGQQLSNEYTLNIPQEYVDGFYDQYKSVDKSAKAPALNAPPPCTKRTPPLHQMHPLDNNKLNGNINKSRRASRGVAHIKDTRQKPINPNELKQMAKFWGPGHPTWDSIHGNTSHLQG